MHYSISIIIGVVLVLWVLYDLFTGQVYLHRAIRYKDEPVLYTVGILIWSAVALWCFFPLGL